MRLPVPALLLALALAGCVENPDAPGAPTPPTGAGTPSGGLPPPIEDSREVAGGADPLTIAANQPCTSPSAQCIEYLFTLNSMATLVAELSWTLPASDFDLYLFQDGAALGVEGASPPPGTSERLELELEPGEYALVVDVYAVGRDTYALAASFAPPAA